MKIAIVDIETVGLGDVVNVGKDLIVEVGIVSLDIDSGETETLFHSLVKEDGMKEYHKNSWIFRASDLKFSDVKNAKSFISVFDELQDIFNEYPVTAYNTAFDLTHLKRRGLKFVEMPCLMLTVQKFTGKRMKFQDAWRMFVGGAYTEKHRSVDDAQHEALLALTLLRRGLLKV